MAGKRVCSIVYFLKELEVPGVKYLQVNERTNYTSYKTGVELLSILSAVVDDNITKKLKDSPVLTIMCDESTDILYHHKLVINCRVEDPLRGIFGPWMGQERVFPTASGSILNQEE